jgi:hypothetical protein
VSKATSKKTSRAKTKKKSNTKLDTNDPSIKIKHPRPDAFLPPSFQVVGWISSSDYKVKAYLEDPSGLHKPIPPSNITTLGDGVFSVSFQSVPLGKYRLNCWDTGNKVHASLNVTVISSIVYREVCICHPGAGIVVPPRFQAFGRIDPSVSSLTVKLNGTTIPRADVFVPGDGSWSATTQNIKLPPPGPYNLQVCIDGTKTCAQHNHISTGFPGSYLITIDYPGAGSKVTSPFTASGQVNPANSGVTVTMNGTSVAANVPGDGSWSANISISPPGPYTLTATLDVDPNVSASYSNITVDP